MSTPRRRESVRPEKGKPGSRDRAGAPAPDGRALDLADLPLAEVKAHGGEGRIRFSRVWEPPTLRGPWRFVDYAELPPGTSIGEHTHGDNEELYIILQGEGVMRLDGHEFRVRQGSLVLNRPGGTHGLRNDRPSPLKLLVVEVGT